MYRPNSECDGTELEGDVVKEILTFVDRVYDDEASHVSTLGYHH